MGCPTAVDDRPSRFSGNAEPTGLQALESPWDTSGMLLKYPWEEYRFEIHPRRSGWVQPNPQDFLEFLPPVVCSRSKSAGIVPEHHGSSALLRHEQEFNDV
jgi:hypothetical protein